MYINKTFNFLFIIICALFPGNSIAVDSSSASATPSTPVQRTQLVDAGKGKVLLLVRAKFSWTWRNTGPALEEIGLIMDDKDRRSGIYDIFYPASGITDGQSTEQDRTLFERIGLTTGDAEQNNRHYQLKLKKDDAGRTRIMVLDHEGQWQSDEIAVHILWQLHKQLN